MTDLTLIKDFDGMVEKNCFIGDDGKIYSVSQFGTVSRVVSGPYVHPETMTLCYMQKSREVSRDRFGLRAEHERQLKQFLKSADLGHLLPENVRLVNTNTLLEKRERFWFIYALTPYTRKDKIRVWVEIEKDKHVQKQVLYKPMLGRPSIRVLSIHQMSKRLMKKYNTQIAGNPF
ncbi:MAG: hypothetical protein V4690_01740 [Patescibacteria group bacterium]